MLRIRTIEEQACLDAEEREAERRAILDGPLPDEVEEQCRAIEATYPDVRAWLRTAFRAVFDAKGHASIHDDETSRTLADLILWLSQASGRATLRSSADVQKFLLSSWSAPDGGLGFTGFAPEFIDDWWTARVLDQSIDAQGHFTPAATARLLARIRS